MSETAGICKNRGCLRLEHRPTDLRCPNARLSTWLESSYDFESETLGMVRLVIGAAAEE